MEKSRKLNELKQKWTGCNKCKELFDNRTNVVFGVGDPEKCKIVIIGEAPGMQEDLKNEPFVGRSGQVLNSLLEDISVKREEVYITNTILCRPPDNRNPNAEELKNCRERLDEHIKLLDPKVVITLGNFSTKYMLGTKEGISRIHGKIFDRENMRIVPIYHPAVLLYSGNDPKKREEMLKDFMIVKDILEEKTKIKSLKDFM